MTRRTRAALAALVVAAGLTIGTLLLIPASPGHSHSYRDGYTAGVSLARSGEPEGSMLCGPMGGLDPKGDNAAQYLQGCNAGYGSTVQP
jgi:hypothetical protein